MITRSKIIELRAGMFDRDTGASTPVEPNDLRDLLDIANLMLDLVGVSERMSKYIVAAVEIPATLKIDHKSS